MLWIFYLLNIMETTIKGHLIYTNYFFRLRKYIKRHLILLSVHFALSYSFSILYVESTCHFNRGKMFFKNQELLTTTVYEIIFIWYSYEENACTQCYCVMIIIIQSISMFRLLEFITNYEIHSGLHKILMYLLFLR